MKTSKIAKAANPNALSTQAHTGGPQDRKLNAFRTSLLKSLRKARRLADLTQGQLAAKIGVSAATISNLEKGKGSVATFEKVLGALNVRLLGLSRVSSLSKQLAAKVSQRKSLTSLATATGLSERTIELLASGGGAFADLLPLLSVIAPKARLGRALHRSGDPDRDSCFTPKHLLDAIATSFGSIDFDPCWHVGCDVQAARVMEHAIGEDGLVDPWAGDVVFVNPPFSDIPRWQDRIRNQWNAGKIGKIICLLPVKTDAKFYHDALDLGAATFAFQGRLKFRKLDGTKESSRLTIMLLAFGTTKRERDRFAALEKGRWLMPE